MAFQKGQDVRSLEAGRRLAGLAAVNATSALAQIVQIGTISPLLSFVLQGRGVEPMVIGLFATAPWLMILAVSRVVPAIIHRLGLLGSTVASLVLSASAILAMPLVENLWGLFLLNLAVGLGLIVRWIACDTWIVRIADEAGRGRAVGTHETLMGLGIALGPVLLSITGVEGRLPFFASAGLLVLALLPLLGTRRWNARPGIPSGRTGGREIAALLPTALLGAFVCGFVETSAISLLPVYAGGLGLGAAAAALLVASFGAGGTILQFPIGWLADALGFRTAQFACAVVVLVGAAVAPLTFGTTWLPWGLLFLWGGAVGGMNTLAVVEAGQSVDEGRLSMALTAIAMAYTVGSIAGPATSGAFMDHMSDHGLMISAAGAALAFIAIMALRGRRAGASAPTRSPSIEH